MRRVLRAIFTLSLVVILGWLVWFCNGYINIYLRYALLWVYRKFFDIDEVLALSLNSFYNVYNPLQSMINLFGIVASAGGAPILYISR